jgi:hypothetical protein
VLRRISPTVLRALPCAPLALAASLLGAGCAKPLEKATALTLADEATLVLQGTDVYGGGAGMTAQKVLFGVKWLTMSDPGPQIVANNIKAMAGFGTVRVFLGLDGRVYRFRLVAGEKGDLVPKQSPVDGITDAVAITADGVRGCAASRDDTIRCFKLADGEDPDLRQVQSEGISGIAEIAVTDHAVAVRTIPGALFVAWDAPRTIEDRGTVPKPTKIEDTGVLHLHRDPGGIAAVYGDGTVKKGRFNGQDFALETMLILQGAKEVALSTEFQCALFEKDGHLEARCAGANDGGQLGDGSTASRALYVPVLALDGVTAIAVSPTRQSAGKYVGHACALLGAGAVRCWGTGERGELGDMKDKSSPKPVVFKTP